VAFASGFVDTPDSCLGLERMDKAEVHLKRIGRCDGKPGRVFVGANPGEVRRLFVDGEFWQEQPVKAMEIVDISRALNSADNVSKGIHLEKNPHAAEAQKAAENSRDLFESAEYQAQLKQETERIKNEVFGGQLSNYYKDSAADAKGALSGDERLYLFVSASMPMHVLRRYAADVARLRDPNVKIVLRGFVGGVAKIMPTMDLVSDMIRVDSSCSPKDGGTCEVLSVSPIIDPMLFRRYGVEQVPAFVYVRGFSSTDPDQSEGIASYVQTGDVLTISGDAGLKHILQRFHDETGSNSLGSLFKKL
jgi:type-F conjugative transfer system pilin assembly protein TrbC